jgi:hypothetical protein
MIKKFCDVCGKEAEDLGYAAVYYRGMGSENKYEVCERCAREMLEAMRRVVNLVNKEH